MALLGVQARTLSPPMAEGAPVWAEVLVRADGNRRVEI